jgi:hypothetical protein
MKVNLYLIRETPKARLYSRFPFKAVPPESEDLNTSSIYDGPTEPENVVWVPLSIVEHTTKNPDGHHIVTLPDWFVEKENL